MLIYSVNLHTNGLIVITRIIISILRRSTLFVGSFYNTPAAAASVYCRKYK